MVLFAGCTQANQKADDPDAAGFIASHPGMTERCKDIARKDTMKAFTLPVPACFKMTTEQQFKGLLNIGWEWSNFCPAPATECPVASAKGGIWTVGSGTNGLPETDGIYEVEFLGRRTLQASAFGHLDQYDHYMMVDRMISARKVAERMQ